MGGNTHCFEYCLKDAFGIREDIIVPESDNAIAATREPILARRIFIRMLAAIEFDDEFRLGAVEIHDIAAHRLLTAKAKAVELLVTQLRPQPDFGVCGMGAKLAGKGRGHGVIMRHDSASDNAWRAVRKFGSRCSFPPP